MRFLVNIASSGLKTTGLAALDYLAPQRCIYCDQPSGVTEAICDVCRSELTINAAPCPRCALPDCHGSLCPDCLHKTPALSSTTAPYQYDVALSYFMHRWKYSGEQSLSLTAAKLMSKAPIDLDCVDIIIATPLHWRRQLARGFNQSQDLLGALCRLQPELRDACRHRVRLARRRATSAQAGATRAERLKNLHNAFAVNGDVAGCAVGIIDDVCTTGATGNAMAEALLSAGARRVHLYCLARTPAR